MIMLKLLKSERVNGRMANASATHTVLLGVHVIHGILYRLACAVQAVIWLKAGQSVPSHLLFYTCHIPVHTEMAKINRIEEHIFSNPYIFRRSE